jgi:hypothetical protein
VQTEHVGAHIELSRVRKFAVAKRIPSFQLCDTVSDMTALTQQQ